MIRAIVFDLGGVYFTDGFKSAISKFSRKLGIPPKKLRTELVHGIGKEYCTGKISRKKFWQEFMKKFDVKYDYEKLDTMWNSSYYINSELRGIVAKLRKKYIVGILSSISKHKLYYLNERYNFFKDFSYKQFSYVSKCTKSDLNTYKILIKKLNIKPNEILYIDDESEHLKVARKAGLKTIHFNNNLKLIRDLKKQKILLD
ncbi:MAG: HAD hydrolase-like protein [Candidatus Woesearchaeota archaeon]